jgi:protein SCO1/2
LAQAETDSGANYAVAHAAQVAGYGPDDIEHVLYFANAQAADYAADLPQLAAMGE